MSESSEASSGGDNSTKVALKVPPEIQAYVAGIVGESNSRIAALEYLLDSKTKYSELQGRILDSLCDKDRIRTHHSATYYVNLGAELLKLYVSSSLTSSTRTALTIS
jgi:hypothetical protein